MTRKNSFVWVLIFIFSVPALWAAADPGAYFRQADNSSTIEVDHGVFQKILDTYLDDHHSSGINRFDYKNVSKSDRKALKNYLAYLSGIKVTSLNKNEQMAYWINMYNALTIDVILDHYPVKSIKEIKSGLFSPGPWKLKLITVENVQLSLNDIEHKILRPIWKDKRIHYTVNCASIGCPNLRKTVYTASNLDSMLDAAAAEYINHPRGVHFEGNNLILSSIYKWYASDFGTRKELLKHLASFTTDKAVKEKLLTWDGSIKYQYNWNLNTP